VSRAPAAQQTAPAAPRKPLKPLGLPTLPLKPLKPHRAPQTLLTQDEFLLPDSSLKGSPWVIPPMTQGDTHEGK